MYTHSTKPEAFLYTNEVSEKETENKPISNCIKKKKIPRNKLTREVKDTIHWKP